VAYSRTFFASIESASIFFSSVFSRSNSFSRFASLRFRCPNCFRRRWYVTSEMFFSRQMSTMLLPASTSRRRRTFSSVL